MQRIKHLSVSPQIEAALAESLGIAPARPGRFFSRSTVVVFVGLLVACAAVAAVLVYRTYR